MLQVTQQVSIRDGFELRTCRVMLLSLHVMLRRTEMSPTG